MTARAAGMGDAYSALGGDLGSAFYNPAGILQIKRPSASFLHYSAIASVNMDYFGYAHPFAFGPMAASIVMRSQPDINNPLAQDNPVSANDIVASVSYAQKPSFFLSQLSNTFEPLEMGATLRYLHSHLGTFDADTVAVDLGARYPSDSIVYALSLLNLGPPIRFISTADPLPATAIFGIAHPIEWGNGHVLNLAADLEYPLLGDIRLHLGAEAWVSRSLGLRVGYTLDQAQSLGGMSAGLTIKLDQEDLLFGFDYAFKPAYYDGFNSFEPQHLLAMNLGF